MIVKLQDESMGKLRQNPKVQVTRKKQTTRELANSREIACGLHAQEGAAHTLAPVRMQQDSCAVRTQLPADKSLCQREGDFPHGVEAACFHKDSHESSIKRALLAGPGSSPLAEGQDPTKKTRGNRRLKARIQGP